MTETLGVHISPAGVEPGIIAAVRHRDAGPTADAGPVAVELGDHGPVAACVVARDDSGALLVGDAATRADGPRITDPLDRAAAGDPRALVAVLNHVIGRATATAGEAPGRLAVVIPDHWDVSARDRIVAAGVGAGVADVVMVPHTAATAPAAPAEHEPSDSLSPELAAAAGAARVAAAAAAPIVTREDLGETIERRPAMPPPTTSVADDGSASVFDHERASERTPEPPRPAPIAGDPRPAGVSSSSLPPPPPGSLPPPEPEPLRYEPPRWRISPALIIAVVLLALIAAVAGGLLLTSGDDTDTAASTTTTSVASTTTGSTSSTSSTTSTSTSSTTSTSTSSTSSTTSTTSTSSTTTTTTPVPVAQPGPVTLVETGLQFDTGALVRFDQSAAVVLEEVRAVLGDPDEDDDWELHPFCEGSRTRFVRWGGLELVFTEDELDSEEGRFTQWYASEPNDPTGLVTRDGLGVTATVGFLEVTYGSALVLVAPLEGEEVGLFAVTNPGSGGVLNGTTSSLDPEGRVLDLWAGDSCTRVFI